MISGKFVFSLFLLKTNHYHRRRGGGEGRMRMISGQGITRCSGGAEGRVVTGLIVSHETVQKLTNFNLSS